MDKQIYADAATTVSLRWLGFAALVVTTAGRRQRVAGAVAKDYFLAVASRFRERGQPPVPANRRFQAFVRQFASALVDEPVSGPAWTRLASTDPRHVADSFGVAW